MAMAGGCALLMSLLASTARGVEAFPGAEGFGAASVGGRGGQIIHVTNLNSSGPGSLAAAAAAKGPRTVVFDVSGVINGDVVISDSNITIAGQTAPGAGITISGQLRTLYSNWDMPVGHPARHMYHDIIVRDIRVRLPQPRGQNGDAIQMTDVDRVILDHVSAAWGNDENIDLCASRDVTVQWSTIEESENHYWPGYDEGVHNYGMIFGYAGKNISLHHNLFAHQRLRTPLTGAEPMDERNNVIYNPGGGITFHPPSMNRSRPGEPFQANIIGNYFKDGPSQPKIPGSGYLDPVIDGRYATLYDEGNYFTWYPGGYLSLDNAPAGGGIYDKSGNAKPLTDSPYAAPGVATQDAETAYALVLAQAGSWPRDATTRRTIEEVINGTGSWGRNGLLDLLTSLPTGAAPLDTDRDGMPDLWEGLHGLNAQDMSDGNWTVPLGASPGDRHVGYTYVEYYLNELADSLLIFPWLAGDANVDGKVDGGDLAIWQANYDPLGLNAGGNSWYTGDFNGDGKVDGADLIFWQRNYSPLGYLDLNAMAVAQFAGLDAVPEPATLALLSLVAPVLFLRRRRRQA